MQISQVLLLVAVFSLREAECNCGSYAECSLLEWMEWGSCEGPCGGITIQTRKRSVCVDIDKIQPFTPEHVISYCNFTSPISETRQCQQCRNGVYNVTASTCDQCANTHGGLSVYEFPKWFRYLEISVLTLTSVTVVLTAGCVCLKCCRLCGCPTSDDDNDDDERDKIEAMENYRVGQSRLY